MSQIKPLSTNITSSYDKKNNNNVGPNLSAEYNQILNNVPHQLFFDPNLSYDQQMVLLNYHNTTEGAFIQVLTNQINQLNIDADIREHLFTNMNELSADLGHVNMYTNTQITFNASGGSDEELQMDVEPNHIGLDAADSNDKLENVVPDEMEL
ncbi:unnamed protein product [Adineta steineri]|uniref:Uncharacterized protein n=1 Tax=Adineta steineri TaxID=433720 RepID=A0A819P8H9_9BILA|nr:unnamed protein product [Adineta steineri]CAF4004208.1 unnamed protein product [Adineta steineri]